jgi:hypothetical protein
MRKIMLLALTVTLLGATAFSQVNLGKKNTNWKVYNGMPASKSFWDINQAQTVIGGVSFPIQQFISPTTGSFAIYLLANYNTDITGLTLTADANWSLGTYSTRSTTFPGAHVRFVFQDVTSGTYSSNDYWWSSVNLDLNSTTNGNLNSGTLEASLADRSLWTNVCGQSATDTTPHPGPNCVGGTDPAVSPSDGFSNAMKNVKLVGLAFGSDGSYASGIAMNNTTGAFTLTKFLIAP